MHCFYTCISLKIQMKVAWNLKGAGITGYSASEDELKVLHDVYSAAVQPGSQKASYIVQFLWRDLTSGFDLIGPYFPVVSSMSSNVLQELIMLCLKALSSYGFKVSILLCDGASSNLTVLKLLSGNPKAQFPVNSDAETLRERYHVDASFINPEDPHGNPVFLMICPSHQVLELTFSATMYLHIFIFWGTLCLNKFYVCCDVTQVTFKFGIFLNVQQNYFQQIQHRFFLFLVNFIISA